MGVIFFVGRIFLTILLLGMDETQWKESTKGSPFEGISALTLAIMAGIGALTDIILVIGKVTLYNAILRIARNFLETRENIKISTHPFYHVNLD